MPAINLTAEFSFFVNIPLPQNFRHAGYVFEDLSRTGSWCVREANNESGLNFRSDGVKIILPVAVQVVDLRVGFFAHPVKINVIDSTGNTVRTQTFAASGQFLDVRLVAAEIAEVSLIDGGNEAILAKISTVISIN